MNQDIRYLWKKHQALGHLGHSTLFQRTWSTGALLEALRRVDGKDGVTRPYLWGVCRNVAKESV